MQNENTAVELFAPESVASIAPDNRGQLAAASRVTAIITKSGKVTGHRFTFGEASLTEFKAALTRDKVRGNARREALQSFFHADEISRRRMLGRLFIEHAYEQGMAPDSADLRGKSATLRMVSTVVPESKAKAKAKAKTVEELEAEIARLKAELAAK